MEPNDQDKPNQPDKVEPQKPSPTPRPIDPPRDKYSNPGKDIEKRNDTSKDKNKR